MKLVARQLVEIKAQDSVGGMWGGRMVRLIYEKEEGKEESDCEEWAKGEREEVSVDEEGSLERVHMEGEGMNWLNQVVPTMELVWGVSSELFSSQELAEICGPSAGLCREYISILFLKEIARFRSRG